LTWLAVAAVTYLVVGSVNLRKFGHLAVVGVFVQGRVVDVLPDQHGSVRYVYSVAGRNYSGQMQPRPPNRGLGELSRGDTLVVYYDPTQPQESVLGDPRQMLTTERMIVGMATVILPTGLLMSMRWYRKKVRTAGGGRA
jgi:Protein of unknown function (DUF3592)